jgi:8-oxo-dGTP pyrophosphatase MutT (NUDIX family)
MEADPYVRVSARELYRNPWLAVEAHQIVHPGGQPGEHVLILAPKASAVVVEDGPDLLFARQPRFAARRWVVEIVKGGRDPGESPLACARRELREELGIVAGSWSELGSLYEIPSIVDEPIALFLARGLRFESPQPECNESVELVRLAATDALRQALQGGIDDAVTVAAIFRYAAAKGMIAAPP